MHQRASGATRTQEIKDHIENLRMQNGWHFKVFAGSRRSGKHKDA